MNAETTDQRRERNNMILFLSNLHGKWRNPDSREVYDWSSKEGPYTIYGDRQVDCMETNEAPLKDVLEFLKDDKVEHPYLDAVFCFVTNEVRNRTAEGVLQKSFTVCQGDQQWQTASADDFFWNERAGKISGITFRKAEGIEDIGPLPKDVVWRIQVPFNEDKKANPMKSVISSVTAMENLINAYLEHEGVPWEKCNIYADTTGGFRTANMAMSAVMQLLTYQNAKIRRVVYSDQAAGKVSDIQPINDMYRLVAGVDAFTKYGSSAALKEYFKDVEYPKLQKLLSAMNAFSESVLLCQPEDIVTNLKELIDALEDFPEKIPENEVRPPKVELFARMLKDIKSIYMPMWPREEGRPRQVDRIAVINWCVKNTLLQQAVTFCTEWLPEIFVSRGVLFTEDDSVQLFCNEMTSYRSGVKNFIMEFCTANRDWKEIIKPKISGMVEDLSSGKANEEKMKKNFPDRYHAFIHKVTSFIKTFEKDLKLIRVGISTNNQRLETMVKNTKVKKRRIEPEDITREDILLRLRSWVFEPLYEFGYPEVIPKYEYENVVMIKKEDDAAYKEKNAANVAREMLRCGMIRTEFRDPEKAVDFIERYTNIRTSLRNKICHASEEEAAVKEDSKITISSVSSQLRSFLEDIERLDTYKDQKKPKYSGQWAKKEKKETTS